MNIKWITYIFFVSSPSAILQELRLIPGTKGTPFYTDS